MHTIFIGTSGFNYKEWKGVFYPENLSQKKWLSFYSQQFNTVEINATFYGSFKTETIENWYKETPRDFLFAVKGSRFITHIKRLNITKKEIERFFEEVMPLKEKLSCVLWQFPANFVCNSQTEERIRMFIEILPKRVRQVFKFRHQSLLNCSIVPLLKKYNIGWVISDAQKLPLMEQITADFVYIRFHGPGRLYASSYSDDQLQTWAEKISSFLKTHDVYCYFNNDFYGYAIKNAETLTSIMNKEL